MYDWQSNCGYSSGNGGGNYAWGNFVNNYYIAGNSTLTGEEAKAFNAAGTFTHLYQSGNKIDPNKNGIFDGTDTGWSMFAGTFIQESSLVQPCPAVYTQTADDALQTVLNYSGANWQNRDSVDADRQRCSHRRGDDQELDDRRGRADLLSGGAPSGGLRHR